MTTLSETQVAAIRNIIHQAWVLRGELDAESNIAQAIIDRIAVPLDLLLVGTEAHDDLAELVSR